MKLVKEVEEIKNSLNQMISKRMIEDDYAK